jgi:hypothetical protein
MHVARFAADESLIDFDFRVRATDFDDPATLQSQAQPMQNKPCRLLSDADSAVNFVRANPIAATGKHPQSHKPLVQSDWRIFENGSQLDGELPIAVFAFPAFLSFQVIVLFVATGGAGDTLRPAERGHGVNAYLFVAEVLNGLLQSVWLFHDKKSIEQKARLVKYIIAVLAIALS